MSDCEPFFVWPAAACRDVDAVVSAVPDGITPDELVRHAS